jgi:receptor protein-tyrosine kinase
MSIIEQATKRLEALTRSGTIPLAGRLAATAAPLDGGGAPLADPPVGNIARLRPDESVVAPGKVRVARELHPRRAVTLDLRQLELTGCLVPSDTRSPLAEQLRAIKRPLLKNARSKQCIAERLALIMVTSALPGEGKTHTSINLAMSIATEIDTSVLLIDADVVRHGAMTRLGVRSDAGLLDLLADESLQLEDVAMSTNVPKLSLLSEGNRNNLSTELFASAAMDNLLHRLASEFPRLVVIFDAPPLLLTSEAKVLAGRVGQVVMVVEAERTQRAAVGHAFAAVDQCPIVMSILNKTKFGSPDAGDGYGYGYGYY